MGVNEKKPSSPVLKQNNKYAKNEIEQLVTKPINLDPSDLLDRVKSFEMFRKSYRKN